jgi:hypothetical protein
MDGLWGHAVIMLATLGRVCEGVNDKEAEGKAGSGGLRAAGDGLRGWGGAGLIPSMGPTC